MKRLKYLRHSREIKIFLLLMVVVILLISCEKSDDSDQTYLGKQNTFREYETTEWRYELNTNIPFIKVPNSLYKNLPYDSTLISEGLVANALTTETVTPYDITWNTITNPDVIKSALVINVEGQEYNLETNLRSIENNFNYTRTIIGGISGLWYEDSKQLIMILNDTLNHIFLAKPLHVGAEWVRESRQYRNSNGVYELFQQECKVLGIERVIVKAGEFSAFKIEVMNHWVDIPSKSVRAYEYYVPDVGIVLMETDGIIHQALIPPFGEATTTIFHQKVRKELVNYSFIKF